MSHKSFVIEACPSSQQNAGLRWLALTSLLAIPLRRKLLTWCAGQLTSVGSGRTEAQKVMGFKLFDSKYAQISAQHGSSQTEIVDLIPALRAFARTFCRNPTEADDLVQETLLKGIANFDRFEPGSRMKSWLFTIMRNTFYTKIKISAREAPGADGCASLSVSSAATQVWSVRGKELQQAIQSLPAQHREVIMLIGVLGVSYEDAAQICGCVIGTIKSRLNRAREGLLKSLCESSAGSASSQ